jgi:hypothetical protein
MEPFDYHTPDRSQRTPWFIWFFLAILIIPFVVVIGFYVILWLFRGVNM